MIEEPSPPGASVTVERIEEGETYWMVRFSKPVRRYPSHEPMKGLDVLKRKCPDRIAEENGYTLVTGEDDG